MSFFCFQFWATSLAKGRTDEEQQLLNENWIGSLGFINQTVKHQDERIGLEDVSRSEGPSRSSTEELIKQGVRPKHPIFLVSGLTSSPLSVYGTLPCAEEWIGKPIWSDKSMAHALFKNKDCLFKALTYDPADQGGGYGTVEGHYVRSVGSLTDVLYFVEPLYFIWDKLFGELLKLGYSHETVKTVNYDWRLKPSQLQSRDLLYTKIRNSIEELVTLTGEKAVIVTHSYGSIIWQNVLFNTELLHAGDVEKNWITEHIEAVYHIASPWLGAPKVIPLILSGELAGSPGIDRVFQWIIPLDQRTQFLRSIGSLQTLMPVEGFAQLESRPIILSDEDLCYQEKQDFDILEICSTESVKPEDLLEMYNSRIEWETNVREWSPADGLTQLPSTSFRQFVTYGVGIETQVGFYYEAAAKRIDATVSNDEDIRNGVVYAAGDATVPHSSLAWMPRVGWKNEALNPHGIQTVVREVVNWKQPTDSRIQRLGGGAEHVDILSNWLVIDDVLKIATTWVDNLHDTIFTKEPRSVRHEGTTERKARSIRMKSYSIFHKGTS